MRLGYYTYVRLVEKRKLLKKIPKRQTNIYIYSYFSPDRTIEEIGGLRVGLADGGKHPQFTLHHRSYARVASILHHMQYCFLLRNAPYVPKLIKRITRFLHYQTFPSYRESTNIGHTLYLQNAQDI